MTLMLGKGESLPDSALKEAKYYRTRLVKATEQVQNYQRENEKLRIENEKLKGKVKVLETQIKENIVIGIPFTKIGITKDHVQGGIVTELFRIILL